MSNKKYMTEEQANKVLVEGNNLYRKWFQIEMPIRQDIAEQLMDFDGYYQEGKNREVKLKGESLYYAFSRLCRLVDFKKTDLTKDVKQYIVYSGYVEDTIYKKVLKMGKGKWNGIKKLLYNCGMLEIVKRTFTWYENGEVRNGTKNVYIINRIPSYCKEEEYCVLDFNFRDYDEDKANNALSKQYILKEEKPESSTIEQSIGTSNQAENTESSTIEQSTIEHSTVEHSTIEQHIKSLYDLSSSNINNQDIISNQSINLSNSDDGKMDRINEIINNCELEYFKDYEKYRHNADKVINSIKTALIYMYYAETFRVNGISLPQAFVREEMNKLEHLIIDHALDNFEMASKTREIKNAMSYLQVCIFNAINSSDIEVEASVNYDLNNTNFYNTNYKGAEEGHTKKTEKTSSDDKGSEAFENTPIIERYKGTVLELPLTEIREEITSISYKTYFNAIQSLEIVEDNLVIRLSDSFAMERLQRAYRPLILEKFKQLGVAEIEIINTEK